MEIVVEYFIESIGASFSENDAKKLAELFTKRSHEGFKFHSVFNVEKPAGCFGGKASVTYLAVYEKE